MKSSFLDKMSLLKVLQELLRPWYRSASNHKPNRPLKKYTPNVRLYLTRGCRGVLWRKVGNSENRWDWTWRLNPGKALANKLAFIHTGKSQQSTSMSAGVCAYSALRAWLQCHQLHVLLMSSLPNMAGVQLLQSTDSRDLSPQLSSSLGGEMFMHPQCKPWPDIARGSLLSASLSCTVLAPDFISTNFWNWGPD